MISRYVIKTLKHAQAQATDFGAWVMTRMTILSKNHVLYGSNNWSHPCDGSILLYVISRYVIKTLKHAQAQATDFWSMSNDQNDNSQYESRTIKGHSMSFYSSEPHYYFGRFGNRYYINFIYASIPRRARRLVLFKSLRVYPKTNYFPSGRWIDIVIKVPMSDWYWKFVLIPGPMRKSFIREWKWKSRLIFGETTFDGFRISLRVIHVAPALSVCSWLCRCE